LARGTRAVITDKMFGLTNTSHLNYSHPRYGRLAESDLAGSSLTALGTSDVVGSLTAGPVAPGMGLGSLEGGVASWFIDYLAQRFTGNLLLSCALQRLDGLSLSYGLGQSSLYGAYRNEVS
jgi:hypothetical protein